MKGDYKNLHPAKKITSRLFWTDHSDRDIEYQVLDLLHDIRFLLVVILIIVFLK